MCWWFACCAMSYLGFGWLGPNELYLFSLCTFSPSIRPVCFLLTHFHLSCTSTYPVFCILSFLFSTLLLSIHPSKPFALCHGLLTSITLQIFPCQTSIHPTPPRSPLLDPLKPWRVSWSVSVTTVDLVVSYHHDRHQLLFFTRGAVRAMLLFWHFWKIKKSTLTFTIMRWSQPHSSHCLLQLMPFWCLFPKVWNVPGEEKNVLNEQRHSCTSISLCLPVWL